jgi:hypothetical protein
MNSIRLSRILPISAMAFVILVCGVARAQQKTSEAAAAGQPSVDISGLWLVQDPGSGSWTEFFENSTGPAPVLPEIQKYNQESRARQRAGDIVNRTAYGEDCPTGNVPTPSQNLPMLMATSRSLNIVQGREEILIGSESERARFIYLDGRDHSIVKTKRYRPSGNGHSIGHWEGNTLVVDTVGFWPKTCDSRFPIMRTPGGGLAKDTTHLEERIQLVDNGEALAWTFTWDDPTIFTKPFRYTYKYRKIPQGYPTEDIDDARDAGFEQRLLQSIIPPPQK